MDQQNDVFTMVLLAEQSKSTPIFAVYFPDEQFGYLYHYLKYDEPKLLEGNSVSEFRRNVQLDSSCTLSKPPDSVTFPTKNIGQTVLHLPL